jgi:hypothetical protein
MAYDQFKLRWPPELLEIDFFDEEMPAIAALNDDLDRLLCRLGGDHGRFEQGGALVTHDIRAWRKLE